MITLLPCPFCGGAAKVTSVSREILTAANHDYWVLCDECYASSGVHLTAHEAAGEWNTRVGNTYVTPEKL